jgi:hypothetical protein
MSDVYTALSYDLEMYDGMAIRGVWGIDEKPSYIEHINFADLRKHLNDDAWWYCEDWTDSTVTRRKINTLNLKNRTGEFILVHTERAKKKLIKKTLEGGVYPTPPYIGGIRSIMTDIEISKYDLAEIVNGFMMGTMINFANGVPENDEDKEEFEQSLKDDGQGADNANSLIVTYSDGKDREPTVHSLTGNNLADRYIIKGEAVTDKILRAHSVTTPLLFGVKEAGQLGGTAELETGYAIMKANYFSNRQKSIASLLQYIFNKCYMVEGDLEFEQVNLNLAPTTTTQPVFHKHSSEKDNEEKVIAEFRAVGKSRSEFKTLKSAPLTSTDFESENSKLLSQFKTFESPITAIQREVLGHISKGETFNSIVKATGLSGSVLAGIYNGLTLGEFISESGELLERGMNTVAQSDQTRIEIRYSYELRPDAPALIGESRPFCKELIALDRFYTREEIDFISSKMGFSVWNFRGGWYHNPETGRNTPFCRHTWQQNVIFN